MHVGAQCRNVVQADHADRVSELNQGLRETPGERADAAVFSRWVLTAKKANVEAPHRLMRFNASTTRRLESPIGAPISSSTNRRRASRSSEGSSR